MKKEVNVDNINFDGLRELARTTRFPEIRELCEGIIEKFEREE